MLKNLKSYYSILTSNLKLKAIILIFFFILNSIFELISLGILLPLLINLSGQSIYETNNKFIEYIFSISSNYTLIEISLFIVFIYTFKNLFLIYMIYFKENFTQKINVYLSRELFSRILNKPYEFFFEYNSSKLINLIINDTRLFSNTLVLCIDFFGEILIIIFLIIFIFLTNINVGFILVLFILIIFVLVRINLKTKIISFSKDRIKNDKKLIMNLQESIYNIKIIKLLNKFNIFIDKFNSISIIWSKNIVKWNFLQRLPRYILELLGVVLIISILISHYYLTKNLTETFILVSVLIISSYRIFPLTSSLIQKFNSIVYGLPILEKIKSEISEIIVKTNIPPHQSIEKKINFEHSIKAENLCFQYSKDILNNNGYIIKNLNFEIFKGEKFAVIGKSGSGKSTLVDLLMGFINPTSGNIIIDKQSISNNIFKWQKIIGYVPQNIFLHDSSILDNILLGEEKNRSNIDIVKNLLNVCELDEWINSLEEGLDTTLGENAIKISGGQLQRIGIMRALFRDPKILILDEATSALDLNTENKILKNLKNQFIDKTMIIISHRENVLSFCDNFINLNKKNV